MAARDGRRGNGVAAAEWDSSRVDEGAAAGAQALGGARLGNFVSAATPFARRDKLIDLLLEENRLLAMIGKAELGPVAIESIRLHKSAYLIAIRGEADLTSSFVPLGARVGGSR